MVHAYLRDAVKKKSVAECDIPKYYDCDGQGKKWT